MTRIAVKRVTLMGALAVGLVGLGAMRYVQDQRAREERRRTPSGGPKLAGIDTGMLVQTVDEFTLGPIAVVWRGVDPDAPWVRADEAVCSRLEVRQPGGPVYVPYGAIGGVAGDRVILNVSASEADQRPWRYRPAWLPPPGRPQPVPPWAS